MSEDIYFFIKKLIEFAVYDLDFVVKLSIRQLFDMVNSFHQDSVQIFRHKRW